VSDLPFVIGVDVGGTFTDVVVRDEVHGVTTLAKVPSTPKDQSIGFMDGLAQIGATAEAVALVIHGTTVATNAVIERKGVSCLLVTTEGFRDVLEMGRRDRPEVYGLRGSAQPLIPRHRRIEVRERTRFDGSIEVALDPADVVRAVEPHIGSVEAIVVSFLHSYANTHNEDLACAAIRSRWPKVYVVGAGTSLPKIGEFERTSTAAVHAYVQPIMARYLRSLESAMEHGGYRQSPAIVQCNGGIMSLAHAVERPANTVRSGPAAGVIAGAAVARSAGYSNAITADMGGTSFDVALVVDGEPVLTDEITVDFRIPLLVPTIDVETIGAGGGSIARIDGAGILQVGPESAGSDPGPACYGRGGQQPTVTDANVVLGRINADRPIGGSRLDLDGDLSRQAVDTFIARPLGLSVEDAAEAILRVIDSRMAGQARIMSVGRGHDPRDFAIVAFGGAGPLHASSIMRETGVPRCLIPPVPGVTSAIGCIDADVQYDFVQSIGQPLQAVDLLAINKLIDAFADEGREQITKSGVPIVEVAVVIDAEMHFEGQRHPIRVQVQTPLEHAGIEASFRRSYARRYGTLLEASPVVVEIACRVIGRRPRADVAHQPTTETPLDEAVTATRSVFFDGAWHDTRVLERNRMARGMSGSGPMVIEQDDTTTIVHPGVRVWVDGAANVVLDGSS
jgi:N-methylhydantoinase A